MASAIQMVTIGVTDMEEALHLFRDVMGLHVDADYSASPSLKACWRLPSSTHVRLVELSCDGHPYGIVRIVAFTPPAQRKVRSDAPPGAEDSATDIGPKAIDFYVQKPIAEYYDTVRGLGYRVRSAPVLHEVGDTVSEEFVFWGPDGVPILLMVGHRHDPAEMRPGIGGKPYSEVATISIVAGDLQRSRLFYGDILGLKAVTDTSSQGDSVEKANELTGVSAGTQIHWILYRQDDPPEPSGKILLLNFGAATKRRLVGRMRPGNLGFSLLTHGVPNLDALHEQLVSQGLEIFTQPSFVDLNGDRRRVLLAEGPNEDLFEFIEQN